MVNQAEELTNLDQVSRRFRPVLMAYFLRRHNSRAEAEDMTQEVFARLIAQGQIEMRSPEGYIFQVAANLLRDRGRRDRVRNDYRGGITHIYGRDVDLLDPLRIVGDREALSILCNAIAELPQRGRDIFILNRLEHVDRRTLASCYGLSLSTIDRELARALAFVTSRMRAEAVHDDN